MTKRMFLSVLLMFGIAVSGANGATRANARGTATVSNAPASQNVAPVSAARAAKRSAPVQKASAPASNIGSGNLTKRAASNGPTKISAPAGAPVKSARAASTQKVIQTGSKVATASSNDAIPQECQDSFFGCMDSFCMLDNASGGRCQCNDKITELDKILEDILKLDKQSYTIATEGVESIQLGDAADQVISQADKAAADSIAARQKKKAAAASTDKKQDLVAWSSFYDMQDDDEGIKQEYDSGLVDTFVNKKGDALYKSAANMCVKSFPEECKQYGKMVQLIYAQRIRSDCIAYENSLKQQKSQSKQKLQTAQKALRDAATEEYKDQNKYGTAGECAIEFAKCMQTTAECGSDYTGCVTLAAKENVRNNTAGTVAKQTTIKGSVSNITLAASTMESLLAKKEICMHVTKQCVNANKNDAVWTTFLRNAAPALKSAEELAEQNLRMQCIPTLAECFKTACKSKIDPKDEEGSYDMCLSNPLTYKSLCKVQLEPCLEATGGTYDNPQDSSLWNGLVAALNSMKVDACTNEVRTCLTERCGDDFSGCVGLDTETIGNLCPVDKLTACVSGGRFSRNSTDGKANQANIEEIRAYVAEIGQGLAVQVDNSMLSVCQKAANDAMLKVCGDTETCSGLVDGEKIGASSLEYNICGYSVNESTKEVTPVSCKKSIEQISDEDFEKYTWIGGVTGLLHWGHIKYDYNKQRFVTADEYVDLVDKQYGGLDENEKKITYQIFSDEIVQLQSTINSAIGAIESDPIVTYCMTGREVQGFDSKKIGKKTKRVLDEKTGKMEMEDASASRFPNLIDQMKQTIIANVLKDATESYDEKYNEVYEQLMRDQVASAEKIDHNKAVEAAKNTCDTWATNSVLPRSPTPKNIWTWIGMAVLAAACVVASVFTGGGSLAFFGTVVAVQAAGEAFITISSVAIPIATAVTQGAMGIVAIGTAAGAAAAAGVGIANQVNVHKADNSIAEPAHAELDQWNYKAKITTLFNPTTGECKKETIYQNCTKPRISTGKCKGWGEEQTETKVLKLL